MSGSVVLVDMDEYDPWFEHEQWLDEMTVHYLMGLMQTFGVYNIVRLMMCRPMSNYC